MLPRCIITVSLHQLCLFGRNTWRAAGMKLCRICADNDLSLLQYSQSVTDRNIVWLHLTVADSISFMLTDAFNSALFTTNQGFGEKMFTAN